MEVSGYLKEEEWDRVLGQVDGSFQSHHCTLLFQLYMTLHTSSPT